jgi:N-acetylglucosamine malate deacetylase 1
MNILVVAPHPDDESIGCGATLYQYAQRGDRVVVAFLTSGELALRDLPRAEAWRIREREASNAASALGLAAFEFFRFRDYFLEEQLDEASERLAAVLKRERPTVVFVPHAGEAHPDHRAAAEIFELAAARADFAPPYVQAYEVGTPLSQCNHVVDVTSAMHAKLRAIRCYASQLEQFAYDKAIRGLNRYRGALLLRCRYAEAFTDLTNPDTALDVGLIYETAII